MSLTNSRSMEGFETLSALKHHSYRCPHRYTIPLGKIYPQIRTTQRDGMGRKEGRGFRMGNTCMPVADSFRYMAEPIQYCQV